MPSISDVISRYTDLCKYCDSFWNSAAKKNPDSIKCKIGCCACCELQSVSAVEAFCIIDFLRQSRKSVIHRSGNKDGFCIFLNNKTCGIYNCRPVICRTHGLLLSSNDEPIARSCILNYQNISIADCSIVLDWETIAMNLMKINMAFCIISGFQSLSDKRFLLSDVAAGIIPDEFNTVNLNQ